MSLIARESDFFVYLSQKTGTRAHYHFVLPKPLHFDINRNWEVACRKLIFPPYLANNMDCRFTVKDLTTDITHKLTLTDVPDGWSELEFKDELNAIVKDIPAKVKFSYQAFKFTMEIIDAEVMFDDVLAGKLGYEGDGHVYRGRGPASHKFAGRLSDTFFGCQTIKIISDIVQPSTYGDREFSILDNIVIPQDMTQLKYQDQRMIEIAHPNFVPLAKTYIDCVNLKMLHEFNDVIHWYGTTATVPIMIQLHFRCSVRII